MDRDQLKNLSPPDAAVALRSYVRRFGELLPPALLGDADLDLTQPTRSGWSVDALVAAAAEHVATLGTALVRVLDTDRPELGPCFTAPVPPPVGTEPPLAGTSLARLQQQLTAAAERVERTPPSGWERTATAQGTATGSEELLRELVAYGRTALDLLSAVVEDTRRDAAGR